MFGGWIYFAAIDILGGMGRRTGRLEWISLVYLSFFVLAVLSPSIYRRNYFGLSETLLEELTIFLFGVAGLITFSWYERGMERREQEKQEMKGEYDRVKGELVESYSYIGSLNRKLDLLKSLADDASMSAVDAGRIEKELFQALAANASAAVGGSSALIRFIDLPRLRTEREFLHQSDQPFQLRVHNKDLRTLHEQKRGHDFFLTDDGRDVLVVASDHAGPSKAYLLLSVGRDQRDSIDASLLKVFVNQAELLYRSLPARAATLPLAKGELEGVPSAIEEVIKK
jgi:hypothetical protein